MHMLSDFHFASRLLTMVAIQLFQTKLGMNVELAVHGSVDFDRLLCDRFHRLG